MPMLGDTMSGGKRILLMPYNDLWRNARKIMHQLLTTKQAESYRPFQDLESRQLMWDYLHDPANFYRHNARYANSGISPSLVFFNRSHHVRCVWQTYPRRRQIRPNDVRNRRRIPHQFRPRDLSLRLLPHPRQPSHLLAMVETRRHSPVQ